MRCVESCKRAPRAGDSLVRCASDRVRRRSAKEGANGSIRGRFSQPVSGEYLALHLTTRESIGVLGRTSHGNSWMEHGTAPVKRGGEYACCLACAACGAWPRARCLGGRKCHYGRLKIYRGLMLNAGAPALPRALAPVPVWNLAGFFRVICSLVNTSDRFEPLFWCGPPHGRDVWEL